MNSQVNLSVKIIIINFLQEKIYFCQILLVSTLPFKTKTCSLLLKALKAYKNININEVLVLINWDESRELYFEGGY